jgi:hypothetical protein
MKGEVILRILAQESLDLELRLQRYGEKKLYRLICNFLEAARAISRIIFEDQGSSWNFVDCGLISKKLRGLFAKFPK